jgi:hypothetical protein
MNAAAPAPQPRLHPVIEAGLAATGQRLNSQQTLLGFIAGIRAFGSAAEFGCGRASWLHAARRLGAETIRGYDNVEMALQERGLTPEQFILADLDQPIEMDRKFDLAICVAGAEQIGEDSAPVLVRTLCAASNWVLFAGAIPYNGGRRRANEHWIETWARLFSECGYHCYDVLRMHFWHDTRIAYYYRQTACLYIRPGAHYALRARGFKPTSRPPSLVHPEMYLKAALSLPGRPDVTERVRMLYQAAHPSNPGDAPAAAEREVP